MSKLKSQVPTHRVVQVITTPTPTEATTTPMTMDPRTTIRDRLELAAQLTPPQHRAAPLVEANNDTS